ncbi:MAG: hypothetical protein GYA62_01085 [Bacteroidales bacterium]|nr:hypothetical protein [Bacteroidales bacterium]
MLYVIEKYNDLLLSFENDFLSCDRQVFNGIVEYLKNNIICSFVVLQQIELIKKIKPIREVGFQNRIDSNDCYRSSVNLKHNLNAYSSLSSQNASVFLIRQSIELKIKNCLGIDVILDSHGYMKKMTADKLIDFVYKNEHIKIPEIGKSIIKKIHSWTQFFIHGGFILNVWQIDIAQEIIRPLFMHGETQKTISIYGSIVIDKVYYETEFRNELKRFLIESCSMEPDIQIIQKNPEAIIE